jgi:hypothetical protein
MTWLADLVAFLAGAPAIIGPALTALVIFLTTDWRVMLLSLLFQYILAGLSLTASASLPAELALAKIVAGALAVLILFLSALRRDRAPQPDKDAQESLRFLGLRVGWLAEPLGLPLRVLAVLLVILALVRLFGGSGVGEGLAVGDVVEPAGITAGGVVLVAGWLGALGFMGLVLSRDPLRVAVSVLTILTGFDLVYSALETSLAVAGGYSALTLVAALGFSYLIVFETLSGGAEA